MVLIHASKDVAAELDSGIL